jgi:anaerobic ribonucleoside-triphosphate reductase activating protein
MNEIILDPSLSIEAKISAIQCDRISAGPGSRTEIFFYGCSRGCPGCINDWTLTQPYNTLTVREILLEVFRLTPPFDPPLVSISGGEPFEQGEALASLCYWLKKWMGNWGNLLVYTGYEFEDVVDDAILVDVDLIVTGPFVKELAYKKIDKSFVGSSNQQVWNLHGVMHMLGVNEYGYLKENE